MSENRDVLMQAQLLVDAFVMRHHAPAIPSLIAACIGWAIEHGAGELVRESLKNAITMSHDAEQAWKGMQS